jgi:hypothetical protein
VILSNPQSLVGNMRKLLSPTKDKILFPSGSNTFVGLSKLGFQEEMKVASMKSFSSALLSLKTNKSIGKIEE